MFITFLLLSPQVGIHLGNFRIFVFVCDSHYSDQNQNDNNQKGYQADNSQPPGSGSFKVDSLAVLEIPSQEKPSKERKLMTLS